MTPEERLIRDLRQALEDRDYQLEKLRRQLAVASARLSSEESTRPAGACADLRGETN